MIDLLSSTVNLNLDAFGCTFTATELMSSVLSGVCFWNASCDFREREKKKPPACWENGVETTCGRAASWILLFTAQTKNCADLTCFCEFKLIYTTLNHLSWNTSYWWLFYEHRVRNAVKAVNRLNEAQLSLFSALLKQEESATGDHVESLLWFWLFGLFKCNVWNHKKLEFRV